MVQTGAPTTGTWELGTVIMDATGTMWVCQAAGTPGTWNTVGVGTVPPIALLNQLPQLADDFLNSIPTTGPTWTVSQFNSGTGLVVAPPSGATGRNEVIGVLAALATANVSSRYGAITSPTLIAFVSPGVYTFWARVNIPVFSTEFTFQIGFKDNANGDPVDGAFFKYDSTTNGGNKWSINTMSNNTLTTAILAPVLTANKWQDLRIVVDAGAGNAKFYIDDVLVDTLTGIPTGVGRETGIGFEIRKTTGGLLAYQADIDFIYAMRGRSV